MASTASSTGRSNKRLTRRHKEHKEDSLVALWLCVSPMTPVRRWEGEACLTQRHKEHKEENLVAWCLCVSPITPARRWESEAGLTRRHKEHKEQNLVALWLCVSPITPARRWESEACLTQRRKEHKEENLVASCLCVSPQRLKLYTVHQQRDLVAVLYTRNPGLCGLGPLPYGQIAVGVCLICCNNPVEH